MGQDGLESIKIKIKLIFLTFYLFSYKMDVSGTTNQKLSKFALQQPTWIAIVNYRDKIDMLSYPCLLYTSPSPRD